jgi:hypothetical protein
LEAKRSGRLVPKATSVMAVTGSSRPTRQPKMKAKSLMNVVSTPMKKSDTKNDSQPPHILAGGTNAKITCTHTIKVILLADSTS